MDPTGLLVLGDNAELLARETPGSAELVVTDPPFLSGKRRRAPAARTSGGDPRAGFEDRWPDLETYLGFLRPRLVALHRLLTPHGSLVVHLDYRVVHEVKIELDGIFGRQQFINEIVWHYTGGGRARRYFSRKHDTLLWYAKGPRWTFNIDAMRVPYKPTSGYARGGIVARSGKHYRPDPRGTVLDDVWEIPIVNPLARERCGYPTQKPERLVARIVRALSNPGDHVVDPFCGSGTTAVVAAGLGRRWIACDVMPAAIATTRRRLAAAGFGDGYRFCDLRPGAPRRRPPLDAGGTDRLPSGTSQGGSRP